MVRELEDQGRSTHESGRRIGVLGGTFDPPHVGHVEVARELADALELWEVLWVTAYEPPHKSASEVSPYAVRAEMAKRAAASDPRFRAVEIERELPTPSYTVRTLEALRGRRPASRLFLILGGDQYDALDTWWRPEELARLATLVVVHRGDERASTARAAGGAGPPARFIAVTPVPVSSSEIRARVARGEPVEALVPPGVLDVIRRERLYLSTRPITDERTS